MTAINHELRKKIESAAHTNLDGIHPNLTLYKLLSHRQQMARLYLGSKDSTEQVLKDTARYIDYCNEQIKALLGI